MGVAHGMLVDDLLCERRHLRRRLTQPSIGKSLELCLGSADVDQLLFLDLQLLRLLRQLADELSFSGKLHV